MLPQFSAAQIFEDFLNQMLLDAGMDSVAPDIKETMLGDLRSRLESRLILAITSHLPEDDLPELAKLMETKGAEDQLAKFIDQKLPNSTELIGAALQEFRNDYLGITE